jgi:hypothetical protein
VAEAIGIGAPVGPPSMRTLERGASVRPGSHAAQNSPIGVARFSSYQSV